MHSRIIFLKQAYSNEIRKKCGSNWDFQHFLFEKKTVERFAPRHVFAQSPPCRRPNDKYPINTLHRSDLCKKVSLQSYLVATVSHIQSVHSQICVYTRMSTYSSQYRDAGLAIVGGGEIGTARMPRAKGSPALNTWHLRTELQQSR